MASGNQDFLSSRTGESFRGFMMQPAEALSTLPPLGGNEVHVWCAALDIDPAIPASAQILSQEERLRAARFRSPHDCERYIRVHAILRSLLGFYLDLEPTHVAFTHGPGGKPALHRSNTEVALHFNLSYSQGIALYAVSRTFEVGIDIELIRPRLESLRLAERFLPADDASQLYQLPLPLRTDAFFQAWTRMEARQKLSGKGLAPNPLRGRAKRSQTATCSEKTLFVCDGYAAGLAVRGSGYTVRYLHWPTRGVHENTSG